MTTARPAPTPNPEAVEELLRIVERLTADERARGQGLDSKTSTLAGFAGTILALTATLGGQLFQGDLGAAEVPTRILFIASVTALAAAATLAVVGVLQPQPRLAVSMDEIERFCDFPLLGSPRMDVQGQMLTTVVTALATERTVNRRKAVATKYAARALVVGFIAVALMAVTLGATATQGGS